MNFDEFMHVFGVEAEDEVLEDAEEVTTDPEEAEADAKAEAEGDAVTATDDNNSADLDGDHETNAFLSEEQGEDEPEEADFDVDPATDILEKIADDEEASGFDKQMEIPTVVDQDTVFDKLQEQTDVQVHNVAEREREVLADVEEELDALLHDSGDTYDEGEFDEIPENPSAEKMGGVDPIESPEHPFTAMINERTDDMEQNEMLIVSTKDQDMDASAFLAEELNDDDTYSCDGSDDCECSKCEEDSAEDSVAEPESVTEDEDGDVVPKDAEPEEDEESDDEDVDVDKEAEKLEDDSDEATDEKIEAGDTSDIELSEDDAPADDAADDSEDGESEDGNIFDEPETFEITDDVVDDIRMPEYTFTPSVTLNENEPEVADTDNVVKEDDVEVEETEGGDDTPLGATGDEAPAEDTEDVADDAEAEADTEEASDEAEEEEEAPAPSKEEPAEIVEESEEDEEEDDVKPAEECGDTDVVPTDATPEDAPADGGEAEGSADVDTIGADLRNDDEANIQELYKEVDSVITVGDDETALDGSSFIVGDEPSEGEHEATPDEHHNDPSEYQEIEEVEMDSQDLSDILEDLEDEPHNIDSEGGDAEDTSDVPAEAEVGEEEPTEDAEPAESSEETDDVEADEVDEADEAIESLFANLDGFSL